MKTADDIREEYKMIDIVERYGLHPSRAGFISCPFHKGDNTASLKIYKDSFYCFGCHAHGDIFQFIMLMDDCSFKKAFESLGGASGKMSDAAILRLAKRKREAERHKQRLEDALQMSRYCSTEYMYCKTALAVLKPFSDAWCSLQNMLPILERNADMALDTYQETLNEGR